jgi:serine/threonine-protein kinase
MASIHLARLVGPVGFSRTVAIKRLHEHFARDAELAVMFLDEARLAARIRHPNVVATVDVVHVDDELLLVMEYVSGESLSRLLKTTETRGERIPMPIAIAIVTDALYGLHAAHEAVSDDNEPLGLVHRDVSPHNIMVGRDGVARIIDFGVAKAAARLQSTQVGRLKGKLGYLTPEQLRHEPVDRRADLFAASIVLWEVLTGERLFVSRSEAETLASVLFDPIAPPSARVPDLPSALDAIVMKGLSRAPEDRYQTAAEMARALEAAITPARHAEVGEWVERTAGDVLTARAACVAEIERGGSDDVPSGPAADAETPTGEDAGSVATMMLRMPDSAPLSAAPSAVDPRERRPSRASLIGWAIVGVLVLGAIGISFARSGDASPELKAPATAPPPASGLATPQPSLPSSSAAVESPERAAPAPSSAWAPQRARSNRVYRAKPPDSLRKNPYVR